ncbi:hypothetical protein FoTM2_013395 [Fusarium oxysporum f. sp. vasinfectum]|nr:hypothetical protein FoTM2_013395 [Fusarium oxysporum f. sp. vasinfectum]
MTSNELASVSSASSSSPQSPTTSHKSSHADDLYAEGLSSATATTITSENQSEDGNLEPKTATLADNSIPAPLEHHRNRMDLFGMWTQNIRNQMVMPEANPISICLQLLGPAVVLLRELQQAVGVEPSSPLGRFTAGTVDGCKTSTVIMEKTIDASFTVEIDLIGKLSLESIGKRFGDSEAPFIHDMIFGDAVLLKLMVDMRNYCHDSEHVSPLPIALQYAAATVYLDFFECCVKVLVQREKRKQPDTAVGKEDPGEIATLNTVVMY